MSIERATDPTPSGDPFYDALIKRLYVNHDERSEFAGDGIYYYGSTERVKKLKLTDQTMTGLREALPIPERTEEGRRALLARGIGCLSLEVHVKDERSLRNYLVVRPSDLIESSAMFSLEFMREHYPDLADYGPDQPRVFRFMPKEGEFIIDAPLEHPYLREVYDEIVGTFRE